MKRIPFTSLMYIIKNYLFKFVKYKYMMQLLKCLCVLKILSPLTIIAYKNKVFKS